MKSFILFLAFFSASLLMACGRHPTCNFLVEVEKDHAECVKRLKEEERRAPHEEAGCKGTWDNVTCWEHTGIGQTATIPCPRFLTTVFGTNGNISRKCTASGWSDVFPNITSACGSDTRQDKEAALHQELHPPQPVPVLHSESGRCAGEGPLSVRPRGALLCSALAGGVSSQPGVVAVLHHGQLLLAAGGSLVSPHPPGSHVLTEHTLCGLHAHRMGNPERHRVHMGAHEDLSGGHRVNFLLFIRIIRILVQKLQCPDVGGGDHLQYGRLAKSTLLLIPLFGIHYVVFVSLSESMAEDYKIFFDLALGSFQGLVVAILYCFLNSEVQGELTRKWRSLCVDCSLKRAQRLSITLASGKGSEHTVHLQCTSRTQSILQSETTVLPNCQCF
ncbi:vasoactive intestinal polypeptide receptor 2 isoform X3 [Phycodurus eques]|uniref:vasoactive intestinal polypeptide receptor 2 isoform X3 n=1 Tax=Phycodurus eques TaxID=693459 RepID=UPI002ACD78A6|nr:vasoactive intestinal polypeptide receptor 2 isoform X3 [Phycodurus eques]